MQIFLIPGNFNRGEIQSPPAAKAIQFLEMALSQQMVEKIDFLRKAYAANGIGGLAGSCLHVFVLTVFNTNLTKMSRFSASFFFA